MSFPVLSSSIESAKSCGSTILLVWLGAAFLFSIVTQFTCLRLTSPIGVCRSACSPTDDPSEEPVINDDTSIPAYGTDRDKKIYSKYAQMSGKEKLDVLIKFYDKLGGTRGFGDFKINQSRNKDKLAEMLDFKVKKVIGFSTDNLEDWQNYLGFLGFPLGACMLFMTPWNFEIGMAGTLKYIGSYLLKIIGGGLAIFHIQDSLYLAPRARVNQHWQMLMEVHDPNNEHDRRVVKMHLDLDLEGIELRLEKDGSLCELRPEDESLNSKIHETKVDVTLFQLVERFMRYRVGIRPLRWLYAKDYVPIEGSMDYICQDLIIDAYTILGLYEGRKHWGGVEGVTKGCIRMFSNPLSPRAAWFKHTDEFTAKFLFRKDGKSYGQFYKAYTPPAPPTLPGEENATKNRKLEEESMSPGRMILIGILVIALIAVLGFAVREICHMYQENPSSPRDSLRDLEAGEGGRHRRPTLSMV